MSPFFYVGIGLGVLALVAYLITAGRKRRPPVLDGGIEVAMSAAGVAGAIKLIAFVFSGGFAAALGRVEASAATIQQQAPVAHAMALSAEDAVFIVLGAVALAWVLVLSIVRRFKEVV